MYKLKVAVMIYGTESLSTEINEWKTFVEANSKFQLEVIKKNEPELTSIAQRNGGLVDCYMAILEDVDAKKFPHYVHMVILLWKLLPGQEPCHAGTCWSAELCSIPYNVDWWKNPKPRGGFSSRGVQVLVHEFTNALRRHADYHHHPLPDPYDGTTCYGLTEKECDKYIYSKITDDLYEAIDKRFEGIRTVQFLAVPPSVIVCKNGVCTHYDVQTDVKKIEEEKD